MSLIADALKRAQSAKVGRRYLTPDLSGVLPGVKESRREGIQTFFDSILSQIHLSPTLLAGLSCGIFLFVALFSYFFYGWGPGAGSPRAASPAAIKDRTAGLILTPPPSIPAVEPLELEKEGLTAKGLTGQMPVEKTPLLQKALEEPGIVKSDIPKVGRKPSQQAEAKQSEKRSERPKVAVVPDLSEEVRRHFNLALFYQEERKFSLARRTYEKVVQMWPLYAEARNNLGVVYKELGMYDRAVAELKKALALNPRYPRAYHNLAVIYQIRGDWRRATQNYQMALSLDRDHLSSYNNLGLVYRSQKRPHEAREVLEKALAIDPYFPQTHYNLALVLEEIGEVERARLHYQKFITGLPGDENSGLVEKVRIHLQRLAAKR